MRLYPIGLSLATFPLAGATATGGAAGFLTAVGSVPPYNLALIVVITAYVAGGSAFGFNIIVQGSFDGVTFVSIPVQINRIVANGTYSIEVPMDMYPHFRVLAERNDGAATATIQAIWLSGNALA